MAVFSSGVFIVLICLSIMGLVSNFLCICYVTKCFNVKKPVFLLLFIDATISCVGCWTSLLCCVFLEYGFLPCLALVVSNYVPVAVGYLITMEISIIRLYTIRLSLQNIKPNEKKVQKKALILLISFLVYLFAAILTFSSSNIPFSLAIEACINGEKAAVPYPLLIMYFVAPCILFPTVSLMADSSMVRILKTKSPLCLNKTKKCAITCIRRGSFDTIPVRATAWSALTLIPVFSFGCLKVLLDLSKVNTATGVLMLLMLFTTLRCPAETFISFAYKSRQEDWLRVRTREVRLKKVIRDAEEARILRMMISSKKGVTGSVCS